MRPATKRGLILAACAAAALFALAEVVDQSGAGGAAPWYGLWGAIFTRSPEPYHLAVRAIDPGGPADRAGLRAGDLVDMRTNSLIERLSLLGQPLNARPVTLSVQRGTLNEKIAVVPGPVDFRRWWSYLLIEFGALWLSLFAALIAWRRANVGGNPLLSTALVFVAIGLLTIPGYFAMPSAWSFIVLAICGFSLPFSVAVWATYASDFARPLSAPRQIALGLCYAIVALLVVVGNGTVDLTLGAAPLLGAITLWFDPLFFYGLGWTIVSSAAVILALVCSGLAIAAAGGVERQRALWSLLPLTGLYGAIQLYGPGAASMSYASVVLMTYVDGIMVVVTPVVLTYVALSRRLIDIGFALNRTVVFAFVSTIVIGAFILAEWAASEWFSGMNHNASVVIGMVVALTLGLSLRYIHNYVDRFVDHVFFRKRHEDEAALRRFAHEASYISDRSTLLERAVLEVKRHTDADDAAVLLREGPAGYAKAGDGARPPVSENDPGIVALRAWSKPIDLTQLEDSALCGEFAFPMISRGDLVGVLVCGPKLDGEAYAPDESDALFALAQGVGSALGALSADTDRTSGRILHELFALREDARRILGMLPGESRTGGTQPGTPAG